MANPNPSPETRFKKGETPNPLGKTSEHRKAEVKAAEIAATIRAAALSRMMEKIEAGELDPMEAITSDYLRLFKDSEDRAHGSPKAAVDHTSSDGSMSPKGLDLSGMSDSALAELQAAMNADPDAS